MGEYTGLRVDVTLTDEGAEIARALGLNYDRKWKDVALDFPWLEYLERWANVGRCDSIPWGDSAYIPAVRPTLDGKRWRFTCSLKNYNGEIEMFIRTVLVEIAEEWHAVEVLWENWSDDDLPSGWRVVPISRRRVLDDRAGDERSWRARQRRYGE